MADSTRKSVNLLPEFFRTDKNSKFLSSTLDQLIQPPQLERIDGYIGSTSTPTYNTSTDVYLTETLPLRQQYQLDPALIVSDNVGNITKAVGIEDLSNEIVSQGGFDNNFDRLYRPEFYSYNPHIDWDKLVNYQQYYWMPTGPETIVFSSLVDIPAVLSTASYTIEGVALSNGMKIKFINTGTSVSYLDRELFVEGVGTQIALVDYAKLVINQNISTQINESFDDYPFDDYPFDAYKRLPLTPEYITINRASQDANPWSRYNRWVHRDVIAATATANGTLPTYVAAYQAQRPIVEFSANIQLYNFGSTAVADVDYIDTVTTDVFNTVEGSFGYYVDQNLLESGDRVIFTADTDSLVNGQIFEVSFVSVNGNQVINLVPASDSVPVNNGCLMVNSGAVYAGTNWWYNNGTWQPSQQHTTVNQAPLFDLFDNQGISYSDRTYYSSSFSGNKIFGYTIGTGTADSVLGFPLYYKNTGLVGSYTFQNYFTTDTFSLAPSNQSTVQITAGSGYLRVNDQYVNVWTKSASYSIPNNNGVYDVPLGLTNNPLNGNINSFTLSELSDHVGTMVNGLTIDGSFPGNSNIRDLGNIAQYGNRLIVNTNPLVFANMFIGNKQHNVVDAIQYAGDQYNDFKMSFIQRMTDIDNQIDPVAAVDLILKGYGSNKNSSFPWNLSDMVAYGNDYVSRTWTVTNSQNTVYPIATAFDPTVLSLRSVLVYLNGTQLLMNTDYVFADNDDTVEFLTALSVGDQIEIKDYSNTQGCYVPSTPTKLGLYPKYAPSISVDDTYADGSRSVIIGHDGSRTVAFGDYRDAIILELEKRIYNNIKCEYNQDLFNINCYLPGAFRDTEYSQQEINEILQTDFVRWAGFNGVDITTNDTYDEFNSFTWNYTGSYCSQLNLTLNGYWRNIYQTIFDTDTPHLTPWAMLGFTQEPSWWNDAYGSAPYTPSNHALWNDIESGYIAGGDTPGIDPLYQRPGVAALFETTGTILTADGHIAPLTNGLVINETPYQAVQPWSFGDHSPVETAWRRSSAYPFAVQRLMALIKPALYAALMYNPSVLKKNIAGQYWNDADQSFLNLQKITVPASETTLTNGYSVFVTEAGRQKNVNYTDQLTTDLTYLDVRLFYKVGGFVSKNKIQVIIDAYDPSSTSPGAVLPPENYKLILNVSNPIQTTAISGIIVQKNNGRFVVRGYDQRQPYFNVYQPVRNTTTPALTIGGVQESYLIWGYNSASGNNSITSVDSTTARTSTTELFYQQGQIVSYNNKFYRVNVSHTAETVFNSAFYTEISSLPVVGGVTVQTAVTFDTQVTKVSYGTEFDNQQQVYDFIQGYSRWLTTQGFVFDNFNADLNAIQDWNLSAQEFLYWTTQNWADNSVIALSPFSSQIKFSLPNSVVDNVFNSFYEYSILKSTGVPFPQQNLTVSRDNGVCTIDTANTADGIYFARLNSVQKEHAMVFDNTTIFNDTIFEIQTSYRQMRMKLVGFRTANWNGDYFSPGFIYDTAQILTWTPYADYQYGDVVKFAGNYYSASKNITGTVSFDATAGWILLGSAPVADLLPNFDYKINQFQDFYSLDIDNFDAGQQKMAQHLTGYTPRVYLNDIIVDPVAQYKFYQGYIKEKGTQNAITKLTKASVYNLQGELDYNEEWAFRVGEYGSYSSYQEIEIPLTEGSFIENPQIVSIVDQIPVAPNNLIDYVTQDSLAIAPQNLDISKIFKTNDLPFTLPTAGYVRIDDVTATAYNQSSLLDIANNQQIQNGDTVWVGFSALGGWDVVRYDNSTAKLTGVYVSAPLSSITFVTDRFHNLSVGDVVSVSQFNDQVNGIYTVTDVPALDQFSVSSTLSTINNAVLSGPGLLYKFTSVRYSTFDAIPSDQELLKLPYGTKLWVDNNGNDQWAVYQKIDNYQGTPYTATSTPSNQSLGKHIYKRHGDNVVLVTNPTFVGNYGIGNISMYIDQQPGLLKKLNLVINSNNRDYTTDNQSTNFGIGLSYDDLEFNRTGYGLIVAGAPLASRVRTNIQGQLRYSDSTSGFTNYSQQGLVKISSINPTYNEESAELVLLSPDSQDNQQFGASVYLQRNAKTKLLAVGAPGPGTAKVYTFQITTPDVTAIVGSATTAGSTTLIVNNTSSVVIGQNVYVPTYTSSTDLIDGNTVTAVSVDNKGNPFVTLAQSLGFALEVGTIVNFYSTATIADRSSLIVSDNGVVVNLLGTLDNPGGFDNQFGHSISGSEDSYILAVGGSSEVYVYTNTNYTQTISGSTTTNFGNSVLVSPDGGYLFITEPGIRNLDQSFGRVNVYNWVTTANMFVSAGTIVNPVPGAGMVFGQDISINSSSDTLAITAIGSRLVVNDIFDSGVINFDSSSTYFYDTVDNSGVAYVYNKKSADGLFRLADQITTVDSGNTLFGSSVAVDESVYVGAPLNAATASTTTYSAVYQFNKIDSSADSWNTLRIQDSVVDINQIRQFALVDTYTDTISEYLDVIDPVKGKIAGIADQEISYKSYADPAVYTVGTTDTSVDSDFYWANSHVGQLWWDLSTVKYVWYEQGELSFRKNQWGDLFPGASIDIYEWVGSQYLPSEWAALADTSTGLTQGISGQPKFSDDSVYSVQQIYNSATNSFSNYYYYWVKNTVILPDAMNRRIAAAQVAQIITDPTTYGYLYAGLISHNTLILNNVGPRLVGNRINLNVTTDPINNKIPKHTQWELVYEGSDLVAPPTRLQNKMIDSLLGHDAVGNIVPDPKLNSRNAYGIQIRPRQSMFANRKEALRNVIEFANGVLASNLVTGNYSFNNLNQAESYPDISTNLYDQLIEDNTFLELVNTSGLEQAEIYCSISNGRVVSVDISNPGLGYLTAPTITVSGTCIEPVVFETTIDVNGSVTSVTINKTGQGYATAPVLTIRPYTVVVMSDISYNGKWSEYAWDYKTLSWNRVRTQKYNTPLYWNYIDWTSSDYNIHQEYTYTVAQTYLLSSLTNLVPGQYVKIQNGGDGNYLIVEKVDPATTIGTFDQDFSIVYKQNGTIEISDEIWNTINGDLGFDSQYAYDQTLYDQTPDSELNYILTALKNDIFINSLSSQWNLFFFRAVKYALSEQKMLDWAFKTSFITVINNAGELSQPPVYKLQDSQYFEQYLSEVKPYHTQIRNYTTNYSVLEPTHTYTTDFDLPAYYNDADQQYKTISIPADVPASTFTQTNTLTNVYPWLAWTDNYLTSGTVRTKTIGLKFDRYTRGNETGDMQVVDEFACNNGQYKFQLSWLADTNKNTIQIYLDDEYILSSEYTITTSNYITGGYYRRTSVIELINRVPASTQKLKVIYNKSIDILNAVERIENYYDPMPGMAGTDTTQLMSGLEYPGTTLDTLPFDYNINWGHFWNVNDRRGTITTASNYGLGGYGDPDGEFAIDSAITGGTWSTTTNNLLISALGVDPSDTIINGGRGFITTDRGYAPEEMMAGHVSDALALNVYTAGPSGSPRVVSDSFEVPASTSSLTYGLLKMLPGSIAGISVVLDREILHYVDISEISTSTQNQSAFSIRWETQEMVIGPRTNAGIVGYTVIGSSAPGQDNQIGLIDNVVSTAPLGSSSTIVFSISGIDFVGATLVYVNGQEIPENAGTNPGDPYYVLTGNLNSTHGRAGVYIHNLSTTVTNTANVWFFSNNYGYFNQIREEYLVANGDNPQYVLVNADGGRDPQATQSLVEINTGTGWRVLQAPDTQYFSFEETTSTITILADPNDTSNVVVYKNNLPVSVDYGDFTVSGNQLTFTVPLTVNDSITIYQHHTGEYEIYAGPDGSYIQLYLTGLVGARVRVVTFNNHDQLKMWSEKFSGSANRRFRISRPVIDDNYLMVLLNGIPLIKHMEYAMLPDQRTVQISDSRSVSSSDTVEVISFDDTQGNVIGYRMFTDMLKRTTFKRLSQRNTTYLTQPLGANDTEIYVEDSSVLGSPIPGRGIPGVVIIDGERIEFLSTNGNILTNLRRGTLGTGPKSTCAVGTWVIDQSQSQTINYNDQTKNQTIFTQYSTNTYVIQTTTSTTATSYGATTATSDGIVLQINPVLPLPMTLIDQVDVFYGGRQLRKTPLIYLDPTKNYYTPTYTTLLTTSTVSLLPVNSSVGTAYRILSNNQIWVQQNSTLASAVNGFVYQGLNWIDADYTVTTATNNVDHVISLNTNTVYLESDIKLSLIKQEVNTATTWVNSSGLLTSTTPVAVFLQQGPSQLPTRKYYGES